MLINPAHQFHVSQVGLSPSLSKARLEPFTVPATVANGYLPQIARTLQQAVIRPPSPGGTPGPQMYPPPWPPN